MEKYYAKIVRIPSGADMMRGEVIFSNSNFPANLFRRKLIASRTCKFIDYTYHSESCVYRISNGFTHFALHISKFQISLRLENVS